MGAKIEPGRFPLLSEFGSDTVAPEGNELDAGLFREFNDAFWCPIIPVGIESVDDGFPGIDRHDLLEHFWFIDLDDKAVEETGVVASRGLDEGRELLFDVKFVVEFCVGEDINVGVFLHELEEEVEINRMETVVPEGRHEIVVGETGVGSGFERVTTIVDCGVVAPLISVVCGDGLIVFSEGEINFKNAMTELIVEQEGFVGIRACLIKYAAEGMSSIRIVISPGIVEIVGRLIAGDVGVAANMRLGYS